MQIRPTPRDHAQQNSSNNVPYFRGHLKTKSAAMFTVTVYYKTAETLRHQTLLNICKNTRIFYLINGPQNGSEITSA